MSAADDDPPFTPDAPRATPTGLEAIANAIENAEVAQRPRPRPGAAAGDAAPEEAGIRSDQPDGDSAEDDGEPHPRRGAHGRRSKKKGSKKRREQPSELVLRACRQCVFWKSPAGDIFANFEVRGHRETWPLWSAQFRRWIRLEVDRLLPGRNIPKASIGDAIELIEAQAYETAVTRMPCMGSMIVGKELLLDRCDNDWTHNAISPSGTVEVRPNGDLPFIRARGALPLPLPELGEGFGRMRSFVHMDDRSFGIVCLWMVKALWPLGPSPILNLQGEHGSAKSTVAELIMSLVSPSIGNSLLMAPRDAEVIFVNARNRHVVAYDNVSNISGEVSDAVSALVTGATWGGRARFKDNEENLFAGLKAFLFTSITEVFDRADTGSRLLVARTTAISKKDRRPKQELMAEWEAAKPFVFGALCTALSAVLRRIGSIKLDSYGRMADFDQVAVAAAPALDLSDQEVIDLLAESQKEVAEAAFENDPVAVAIVDFMNGKYPDAPERLGSHRGGWDGQPTELFNEITNHASEATRKHASWPKSVRSFGRHVDRCKPILREQGFELSRPPKTDGKRVIVLRRLSDA